MCFLKSISIRIVLYNANGDRLPKNPTILNCGFSVKAVGVAIVLGSLLSIIPLKLGSHYLKGDPRQPMVGTCSMLMSAACQYRSRSGEKAAEAVYEKLRFAVVPSAADDGIDDCCFVPADEWQSMHKPFTQTFMEIKLNEDKEKYAQFSG